MAKPYTTEQFWQMYEALPEEIKNALWAPETGDNIAQIIEKSELDEYHNDIVDLCSQVFVGVILPQALGAEIAKLGIPEEAAKSTAQQLNALVFYPAKLGLEKLHAHVGAKESAPTAIEIPTPRHSDHTETPQETEEQNDYIAHEEIAEEQPVFSEKEASGDVYREKIDEG